MDTTNSGERDDRSRGSASDGADLSAGSSLVVAVIAKSGQAIRTFPLEPGDRVVFGREGADVVVDDARCSRKHFEITNTGGKCVLRDLGSANGTYVNGERVSLKALQPGDEVRWGSVVSRVAGKISAPPLQVMVETRGSEQALPEVGPPEESPKLRRPTLVGFEAVRTKKLARPSDTAVKTYAGWAFLPGTWQVCQVVFGEFTSAPKMQRLTDAVVALGGAERAVVVFAPLDQDEPVILAESRRRQDKPGLPILADYVRACGSLGAAVSVPDVATEQRYVDAMGENVLPGTAAAYVSIASLRKHYGVLYAEWRGLSDISQRFSWLWSVAGQVGLLVERNVLAAELKQVAAQLKRVNEELEETVAERTSELATAVERLSAAQAMMSQTGKLATVGELAASVAHELSNPLTAIMGNAQLASTEPDSNVLAEQLNVIYNQAVRANRIVGNMLSLSRRAQPNVLPVDLRDIVRNVLELTKYELNIHGVALKLEFPEGPLTILADPVQTEHAFLNLIMNACQAIGEKEKGQIVFRGRREEGKMILQVEDNGPGIPDEIVDHVFEPFFSAKPVGQGTGLGLAICKSTLESQGGTISVRNVAGGGAVFEMTIPLAVKALEEATPRPKGEAPRRERKRILVVDDERHICSFIKRLLERVGYDAVTAGSKKKALELLEKQDFDILVTDFHMPGGSGMDLFVAAKKRGKDFTGRTIFISGTAGDETVRRAVQEARARVLSKPFSTSNLFALIEAIAAGLSSGTS